MENRYEMAATSIRQAERALETLKDFSENQYKAKGNTMLEEIVDYIINTLSNADYMYCGCKYYHLVLSNMKKYFVFYVYDTGAISSGYPIFSITINGEVRHINSLSEWMMITLIKEWDGFKKELDFSIKKTMEERTKFINNQLCHIGYMNEQLSKWHV